MIHWLRTPATQVQVITLGVVIVVITLILGAHLSSRQHVRDVQYQQLRESDCLLIESVPTGAVPPQVIAQAIAQNCHP